MRTRRACLVATGLLAWCVSPLVLAQSEKISLSVLPRAGQTVRYRMTQDMAMEMTADGDSDVPIPPMKMSGRVSIRLTEAAGDVDEQGRLQVNLTYDEFIADVTINGKPSPMPGLNPLAGKLFIATYAPDGTLADMTGPPGTEQIVGPLKQMLTQITSQVPQVKLAVGETATVPVSTPLPLPIPGSRGMDLKGKSTMRLLSIDADGADRVASCESVLEATLVSAAETPAQSSTDGVALDFAMTGTGKLLIDLDRQVMKLNENTTTLDGTFSIGARDGKIGRMKVHGVMKLTVAETR